MPKPASGAGFRLLSRSSSGISRRYEFIDRGDFATVDSTCAPKTVPVTLSLWASPVPMLYAGGGVGAYLQAIEYDNKVYPASNDTQFGAHLGGGLRFSPAPIVGVDLQGRYVFLKEKSTELASGKFDPSFWALSAGLVIGF